MNKTISAFIWLVCCVLNAQSHASTTKTLKIDSKIYGITLDFSVSLPKGYAKSTQKYPLIFSFNHDGHSYLNGLNHWLSHNGDQPWLQTIVVTTAGYNKALSTRDIYGQGQEKAEQLQNFLQQELLPQLDRQYRTNGYKIFNGFFGSATFGLFTLLTKPTLFNAYIAASPTFGDTELQLLKLADKQLKKLKDLRRFLFISSGNSTLEQPQLQRFNDLINRLDEQAPQSLDWHQRRYDDLNYMSQPIFAVTAATQLIFKAATTALPATGKIAQQGPAAIIACYKKLSDSLYGFDISPQESIDDLGHHYLEQQPAKALEIFTLNTTLNPNSHWALNGQAKAYEALGQLELAVKTQQKTLAVAAADPDLFPYHQNLYNNRLAQLSAALHTSKD
ncbi:MAG: alpha/beta hydrolase-fold protein [Psychrosphaera sp.]|nr:alpha/beta hydrolase-fold protein [Psychrosphaera sp.]